MTGPHSSWLAWLLLVWGALTWVCAWLHGLTTPRPVLLTTFLESALYLALFILVGRSQSVQALFQAVSVRTRVLLGLVLGVVLVAQLTKQEGLLFPFVRWHMYGAVVEASEITWYEYVATLEDGSEQQLIPGDLEPSLGHMRLAGKLQELCKRAFPAGPESTPRAEEALLRESLAALVQLATAEHPSNPVRSVQVRRCRVDLRAYRGSDSVSRQSVLTLTRG